MDSKSQQPRADQAGQTSVARGSSGERAQRERFLLARCLKAYAFALEGSPPEDSQPLVEAIQETVSLLFAKADELVRASRPTEPVPQVAFHERETVAVESRERERWGKAEKLLYEDILALYQLDDQPGMMTSVERLVMLAPDSMEVKSFLEANEKTLRRLYESNFGSLRRIPVPLREKTPVKIPARKAGLIVKTLQSVDGIKTIEDVIRATEFGELMALIILGHLSRSGFIEIA